MKSLEQIQSEHTKWVLDNFGKHDQFEPLLGIVEEVGELAHSILKRRQGIRQGSSESHEAKIKDAIGDIAIYLMDFARCQGYELSEAIAETWQQVKKRDWRKFPINGRTK